MIPPPAAKRAALAAGLLAILIFRFAVVDTWHAPAGDGRQYYSLSQELIQRGRYALGPPPEPLTYVRMPGYPLFLAHLAVRKAPLSMELHLRPATRANVLVDLGTALLLFVFLRRFGLRAAAGLVTTLLTPLLCLLSCYGLTETLATFLSTAAITCALLAGDDQRPRRWLFAGLTGLTLGAGLLVRIDMVALLPAVLVLLVRSSSLSLRHRLTGALIAGAVMVTVFAPWLVRNQLRFGHPYPGAAAWRTDKGVPIPTAILSWERTWSGSAPGESFIDLPLVFGTDLKDQQILPAMFDDEAEHARVKALFQLYNKERWSPAVVDGFLELARERRQRHPFRTFVTLPLQRIGHLLTPAPEWELPMRVRWLGLPRWRVLFGVWDALAYLLAIAGAILLWRTGRQERLIAASLLLWIAGRCALFSFAIPNATSQRYFIEAYPAVLLLATLGAARLATALRQRLRARQ